MKEPIELDDTNFEHKTQAATGATTGTWFVMFYADWWGHCQKLKPTWSQLATELDGKINVAKVNINNATTTSERFRIKGFPTLYLLHRGKAYKYTGDRNTDALSKFALGGFQEEQGENVPKELTAFDYVVRVLVNFWYYCLNNFDSAFYLFGIGEIHTVFKVVIVFGVLFSPAIILAVIILWCESKYVASQQVKPLDVNDLRVSPSEAKAEEKKESVKAEPKDTKKPAGKEKYD